MILWPGRGQLVGEKAKIFLEEGMVGLLGNCRGQSLEVSSPGPARALGVCVSISDFVCTCAGMEEYNRNRVLVCLFVCIRACMCACMCVYVHMCV